MTPERHRQIGDLFHRALAQPAHLRSDFIRGACAGDPELVLEVESLVRVRDDAADFLDAPAIQAAVAGIARAASSPRPQPKTLGRYEVVSLLGCGGMGDVYRAHDSQLRRDVAVKVLPELFESDSQRATRFAREARILASLNHPNIAAVYGIEPIAAGSALVMELIDGVTLADRIAAGAMALVDIVSIAIQTAGALEAAHEQGIVHRDLKPHNIMVRSDGIVKVLDFGLAKAVASKTANELGESSGPGAVLGTTAYMSPEQVRGGFLDRRTDIWAFGCVVYEMLTGQKAFSGESAADILASVVGREPDFQKLPRGTPIPIRRLLRRCLRKNVGDRLRHIGDAVLDLREGLATDATASTESNAPHTRPRYRWPWLIAAGALVLASGTWLTSRATPVAVPVARYVLAFPSRAPLVVTLGPSVAIARDGAQYAVRSSNGSWSIRRRDQLDVKVLGGEGLGITQPFFSHDGNWLGFVTAGTGGAGKLQKIPVRGGKPVLIAEVATPIYGAIWSADDTVIFAAGPALYRVSANGGTPQSIATSADPQSDVFAWPEFLPGGRSIAFTQTGGGTALPGRGSDGTVLALDLDTGVQHTLLRGAGHSRYLVTGHLAYTSGGTLYVVAFDASTLAVRGEPVALMTDVREDDFATSQDGTLIYVTGVDSRRELVWVDRRGREQSLGAPPRHYIYPRLSPDGTKVAVDIDGSDRDVWLWDVELQRLRQLTHDPAENLLPSWSPDGRYIAYGRRTDMPRAYRQRADSAGMAAGLDDPGRFGIPLAFTPDGARLLYQDRARNIVALVLDGSLRREPLVTAEATAADAEPSPDGRWLAYMSNESGRFEIYVRSLTDPRRSRWSISQNGGVQPLWSYEGKELYYRDPTGAMMVVSVATKPTFVASPGSRMFEGSMYAGAGNIDQGRTYDVARDGSRFLMVKLSRHNEDLPASNAVIVVENWFEEVVRFAPRR